MLMVSSNKIKKVFILLTLLISFVFVSCDTPDVVIETSTSNTTQVEPGTSKGTNDSTNSTDNSLTTTSSPGIEIGDNPGNDGYTWGPGQH